MIPTFMLTVNKMLREGDLQKNDKTLRGIASLEGLGERQRSARLRS
jgi:hypothetical protein